MIFFKILKRFILSFSIIKLKLTNFATDIWKLIKHEMLLKSLL